MLQKSTKLFLTTIAAIATINTIETPQIPNISNSGLSIQTEAQARSSGGRSGGGSFSRGSSRSSGRSSSGRSRSSSGSRSRSRSSTPSRSYNSSPSYSHDNSPGYYNNNSRNYSSSGTYYSSGGDRLVSVLARLVLFGFLGMVIYGIVSSVIKSALSSNNYDRVAAAHRKERDNDIVTISKLQIALSASATDVQWGLTELSLTADTSTEEGLKNLLQESIVILLRNSEYWTHHVNSSQKLNINKAEAEFDSLSLEERSKLSSETLSNIEGNIRQKSVVSPDNELAMYIVVTLLVGTAHDKPLFENIRTPDDLKTALNTLGTMPSDYLFKFELIWSPQTQNDSLTYDEFITEYTNMVELV